MEDRVVDIGIVAIINPELSALRTVLGLDDARDRDRREGDLRYFGSITSRFQQNSPLSYVIYVQAQAGNAPAAALATKIIERHSPRLMLLAGISAGIRGSIRIGDVVVSLGVADQTTGAALPGGAIGPRPTIQPRGHVVSQMCAGASVNSGEWHSLLQTIHGKTAPTSLTPSLWRRVVSFIRRVSPLDEIASTPAAKEALIYSNNLLIRDPSILLQHRERHHQQTLVGEMEAAGFVNACRSRGPETPWLVIRAVSDFGDPVKGDNYHTYASRSVMSYLACWIQHVLDPGLLVPRPAPSSAALQTEATDQRPGPDDLRPPAPQARSHRLETCVETLANKLRKSSSQIVALRGRPGDGKSEVALEACHRLAAGYVTLPAASEATNSEAAWSEGLARAIELLSSQPFTVKSLGDASRIFAGELDKSAIRVFLFDNVDALPPFRVRDLLKAGSTHQLVLVGPGIADPDETVTLAAPTLDEFREIVKVELRLSRDFTDDESRLIDEIANVSSKSAMVAKCAAQDCSPDHLKDDLASFLASLRGGTYVTTADVGVINRAIEKCWSSLTSEEKKRVAFVTALGGEIEADWMPQSLRTQGPRAWRMLDRSGVATRESRSDAQHVRLHRLVALWTQNRTDVDVNAEVLRQLIQWSHAAAGADSDELRSRLSLAGPSLLAGVQFLHARRALDLRKPKSIEEEAVAKAYVEVARNLYRESAYEEHLKRVLGDDVLGAISELPPSVLGQLVDNQRQTTKVREGESPAPEQQWAAKAVELLTARVVPRAEWTYESDAQWTDVVATHHLGKHLIRMDGADNGRGAQLLRQVLRFSYSAAKVSRQPSLWDLQAIKSAIQLGGTKSRLPDEERAQISKEALATCARVGAPSYLRLRVVENLLRIQDVPAALLSPDDRRQLIREGLALCEEKSVPKVQAEFLKCAAGQIERLGDTDTIVRLRASAASLRKRVAASPTAIKDTAEPLAHALHAAGRSGASQEDAEDLREALRLYSMTGMDSYVSTRVVAVLRDLGYLDQAEDLGRQVCDGPGAKDFFAKFEYVKTLRWNGKADQALALLEGLESDVKGSRPKGGGVLSSLRGRLGGIRDERAKNQVKLRLFENARSALRENIALYKELDHAYFAERCERWLNTVEENQCTEQGLLSDEWRLVKRLQGGQHPTEIRTVAGQLGDEVKRMLARPKPRSS